MTTTSAARSRPCGSAPSGAAACLVRLDRRCTAPDCGGSCGLGFAVGGVTNKVNPSNSTVNAGIPDTRAR